MIWPGENNPVAVTRHRVHVKTARVADHCAYCRISSLPLGPQYPCLESQWRCKVSDLVRLCLLNITRTENLLWCNSLICERSFDASRRYSWSLFDVRGEDNVSGMPLRALTVLLVSFVIAESLELALHLRYYDEDLQK